MDECHEPLAPPEHPESSGARLLAHSILNESDRGVILVASEYLNTALEERLRLHFIDDGEAQESMLGRDAPFGTFSARIIGAHALGLINREMKKNLDRIRRIRNHCAHHVLDVTFISQNIRDIVSTMPLSPETFGIPPDLLRDERTALRYRFVTNVSHTAGVLDAGSALARNVGRPTAGIGFLHLRKVLDAVREKQGGG